MQRTARKVSLALCYSRETPTASIFRFKRGCDVLPLCLETNDTPCGLTNFRCRKLFSTLSSSNMDKQKRSPKRIPKEKRRVMVEAFVERYKADNAGKFPPLECIRQQVGGSYYIIREIFQMLKYESKVAPEKKTEKGEQEKLEQHNKNLFNDIEDHPKKNRPLEQSNVEPASIPNKMEMDEDESLLVKVSVSNEKPSTIADLASLHGDKDPAQSETTSVEGTTPLSKSSSQNLIDACINKKPYSKASEEDVSKKLQQDKQEDSEQKPPTCRVVSQELMHKEEPTKTSVWSNLKSLADDIISFWRRS